MSHRPVPKSWVARVPAGREICVPVWACGFVSYTVPGRGWRLVPLEPGDRWCAPHDCWVRLVLFAPAHQWAGVQGAEPPASVHTGEKIRKAAESLGKPDNGGFDRDSAADFFAAEEEEDEEGGGSSGV